MGGGLPGLGGVPGMGGMPGAGGGGTPRKAPKPAKKRKGFGQV
jgi:signal recognition particle subunit SRP54